MFKNHFFIVLSTALFSLLNIVACFSNTLSIVLTLFEYALLFYYIGQNKLDKAFYLYIIFISVSLEIDVFIYPDKAPFSRWNFFNPAYIYQGASIMLFVLFFKKYEKIYKGIRPSSKLIKWLKFLLISGVISVFIGVLFDDNNILSSGIFPSAFVSHITNFIFLCCLMIGALLLAKDLKKREELETLCKNIMLGISISAILSILIGYNGYYGDEEIMLAPLLAGFSPCLLCFVKGSSVIKKIIYISVVVAIVFLAFSRPSAIGSKWYLVIAASLFYLIYCYLPYRNTIVLTVLGIVLISTIPIIGTSLELLYGSDNFNSFKAQQALRMLDFSDVRTFEDWVSGLDESARFRVDEPINIAVEYTNKPWFSIFGKGISGSTRHYTDYCDWAGPGAFSPEQIRNNCFYEMHESTAVLFLRHGIVGIVFLLLYLFVLIKKARYSSYAIIGSLWLVFYWSYGTSFRLGAVFLVLALVSGSENTKQPRLINKYSE